MTQTTNYGQDFGVNAVGTLRLAANVADTETVTIGGVVFEFDTNGAVTAGNVAVDVSGGVTPAAASTALVTAVNAVDPAGIRASKISDNEVLLVSKGVSDQETDTAETLEGGNNAVTKVNGGSLGRRVQGSARIPDSQEAALGTMHFAFPFTPAGAIVQIRHKTTGVLLAWDGDIAITAASGQTPAFVTINNDGAADWDADDVVNVIAFE